jgi:hypothetical protein
MLRPPEATAASLKCESVTVMFAREPAAGAASARRFAPFDPASAMWFRWMPLLDVVLHWMRTASRPIAVIATFSAVNVARAEQVDAVPGRIRRIADQDHVADRECRAR